MLGQNRVGNTDGSGMADGKRWLYWSLLQRQESLSVESEKKEFKITKLEV